MRRGVGGLVVGIGEASELTTDDTKQDTIARRQEFEASARIRATTTSVPTAIATPTHSAATTAFSSVSFPSWSG